MEIKTNMILTYRNYTIESSRLGWTYSHADYDGAPDAGDYRSGRAVTLTNVIKEIDYQQYQIGLEFFDLYEPVTPIKSDTWTIERDASGDFIFYHADYPAKNDWFYCTDTLEDVLKRIQEWQR